MQGKAEKQMAPFQGYFQKKREQSKSEDFEKLKKLGRGSYGDVWQVRRRKDQKIYVLKEVDTTLMSAEEQKSAIFEAKILSKINSEYVCKYFDSFMDEVSINIIMEFCEGGDLQQFIKKQSGKLLKEEVIWKFFIEICLGLNYLHTFKILHRDIKSMNIFLAKGNQVKIGDLGVARQLAQTNAMAATVVGTPYYLSPELCEEKPYNHKSDIWSLGCVLYELCTFRYPFEAANRVALMVKILKSRPSPIGGDYSEGLKKLSKDLLTKDQRRRPSLPEIFKMERVQEKMKELGYSLEAHLQLLREHKAIAQGKPRPQPMPAPPEQEADEAAHQDEPVAKEKNRRPRLEKIKSHPVEAPQKKSNFQIPRGNSNMEAPSPSVLKKNALKAKICERPVQSAVVRKRPVNSAAQNRPSDQKEAPSDGKRAAKANLDPYLRPVSALSKNPSRHKLDKEPPASSRNVKDLVNLYERKGHKSPKYKNPYISARPTPASKVTGSAIAQSNNVNQAAARVRNDPKAHHPAQQRQLRDGEGLRVNNSGQKSKANPNLSRVAQQAKVQGQKLIKEYQKGNEIDGQKQKGLGPIEEQPSSPLASPKAKAPETAKRKQIDLLDDQDDDVDLVPQRQSALQNQSEQNLVLGNSPNDQDGAQRPRGKWNKTPAAGAAREPDSKALQNAFACPVGAPAFLQDTEGESKTTNDYFPENSSALEYTALDAAPDTKGSGKVQAQEKGLEDAAMKSEQPGGANAAEQTPAVRREGAASAGADVLQVDEILQSVVPHGEVIPEVRRDPAEQDVRLQPPLLVQPTFKIPGGEPGGSTREGTANASGAGGSPGLQLQKRNESQQSADSMERYFEKNFRLHAQKELNARDASPMPYPEAPSDPEQIQEEAYYQEDDQADGLEEKDAYLESIMDYMAEGNPHSSSVLAPAAHDLLLDDLLLQENQDDEDVHLVRQSLQRMQQDFYGDDSVQQLIADDNEQVPDNTYTESLLEGLDESASLVESFSKIHKMMQQKSRSEISANPSTKESVQDQPKKNTKVLQKKLNIAEKKLAQKMPKFKELNARFKNNEEMCFKLIGSQSASSGAAKGSANEIFSKSYQHFVQQVQLQDEEMDDAAVDKQQQEIQAYIANQCGPGGEGIAEQLLCHFYQMNQIGKELTQEKAAIDEIEEKIKEIKKEQEQGR